MGTALIRHETLGDEQVGLIKRMIAKEATNDELALFLHQCQRTGLDPFSKQIYAISRFSKRDNRKVMSIQVSIDGARLIAERTGKYDSQEGPYWCGEDGQWVDVWLSKGHPLAAKVLVYKVGSNRATTGIAHWSEYADTSSSFWQTKPALMLAKCAESLALRKAFPQELSGLYTAEEMSQADSGTVIEVTGQQIESTTGEIVDATTSPAKPLASEAHLQELDAIGREYYREKWPANIEKWVKWASTGEVTDAKALQPQEVEAIIAAIQKRMADAIAKADVTNGDVLFGK